MGFPKELSKKLGHEIALPKRQKRRLERKRPRRKSLRQWRKDKPKRGTAWLARNQKPLETVAEAKRAIAAVSKYAEGGKAKFLALKSLMSRAYAGKQNRKVIELISKEINKIEIKRVRRLSQNRLSEKTQEMIDELEGNLLHQNFPEARQIIKQLGRQTPKTECRIVASLLESRAEGRAKKIIEGTVTTSEFVETVKGLYYTAGQLFRKVGWLEKALELFQKGDFVKIVSKTKH